MNRTITTERLYFLGDFRNLKCTDVIADIPESLVFNSELMGKIRWLQLIEVELLHEKYLETKIRYKDKSPEEVIALLEQTRVQNLQELKSILNGKLKDSTIEDQTIEEKPIEKEK